MQNFKTEAEALRYQALSRQLKCLVCQNQMISDSNVPFAQMIKRDLAEKINLEMSDDFILNSLSERYGEEILFQPSFNYFTFGLWVLPLSLLLVTLLSVRKYFK